MIISRTLKADEERRKKARREARRLKTISNKFIEEKDEGEIDKDVGEFLCMMIDTGKLGVRKNFA